MAKRAEAKARGGFGLVPFWQSKWLLKIARASYHFGMESGEPTEEEGA